MKIDVYMFAKKGSCLIQWIHTRATEHGSRAKIINIRLSSAVWDMKSMYIFCSKRDLNCLEIVDEVKKKLQPGCYMSNVSPGC